MISGDDLQENGLVGTAQLRRKRRTKKLARQQNDSGNGASSISPITFLSIKIMGGGHHTNREVEIGYGLGKAFEHNGYMTEAVQAMCRWALEQEGVSHIIAETDIDGFAPQRILQRCGFVEKRQEETIWWQL